MDITEVCQECKNYFLTNGADDIHPGTYTIQGGSLIGADFLIEGQYFRITGSKLNTGVYLNTAEGLAELKDETFTGSIWDMSVPPAFLRLCGEIDEWRARYGGADSQAMSPYSSESIGTYSYSKSAGGSGSDGSAGGISWQGVYAARLRQWRRISEL